MDNVDLELLDNEELMELLAALEGMNDEVNKELEEEENKDE